MKRIPYITPATKLLPVRFDAPLCRGGSGIITTSNDPYEDNGDYDWTNP